MSGWDLDDKRYRDEVFKALAAGWQPSEDFFRCYQLPVDVDSDAIINQALKRVLSHLNSTKRDANWATVLRRQHPQAITTLTTPAMRRAHREQVLERRKELHPVVQAEVAGLPFVPAAAVERLRERVAPRFVAADVEAVLSDLGLSRREPVPLPPRVRPPSSWPDIRSALATLEKRTPGGPPPCYSSLREYLLEAVGTVRPPREALVDRKGKARKDRKGDAGSIEIKVLTAAGSWLEDGTLPSLLVTELLEELLAAARFGVERLQRESSRPDVVRALSELGLPTEPEDFAYALLCESRYPAEDPVLAWRGLVESALASRDLRRALSVLQAQSTLAQGVVGQREELRRRLAELDADLARARDLESGDSEAAAEMYLAVARQLDDPEVGAGLRRCHPAPPPRVTATVEGAAVVVTWTPSPARVGDIAYRVVRGEGTRPVGAGGTVVQEAVVGHEVADTAAPAGVPLHYAVLTLRNGTPSTTAAYASPVVVVRDVEQLEVRGGQGLVEGTWRLPRGATGARVERVEWPANGAGQRAAPVLVPTPAGDAFRDSSLREGVTYEYRVRAEYDLPHIGVHLSSGVTGRARTQQRPMPVADLAYEVTDDLVVLSWTQPPAGHVEVRLLDEEPTSRPGRVVPVAAVRTLGSVLRTAAPAGPAGLQAQAPSDARRHWFLPVTVLDELAAIGRPVELNRLLPPVAQLRAERLGSRVRLTWQWPNRVGEVLVVWTRGSTPAVSGASGTETRTITLASYRQGGMHVDVGGGAHCFSVSAVAQLCGERVVGPGQNVRIVVPREVYYDVRRTGWRKPRQELVVEGVDGLVLPDVRLVGKAGVPPQEPGDGIACTLLRSVDTAGEPLVGEFTVPAHRQPFFLRAFAVGHGSEGLVLLPRRPDQLRIP